MTNSSKPPFRITPAVFHVLFSLSGEEAHAYGIMKEIEARTGGGVRIGPGSLHFTLGKLLDAGLIEEADERPESERRDARRRYFLLSTQGRAVLQDELRAMADTVALARERDLVDGLGEA